MRVVVLGLGISGTAVIDHLLARGDEVIGVDRTPKKLSIPCFLESAPIALENVDLLVKSPGIPSLHPWVVAAQQRGIPIRSEIDLAFEALQGTEKTLFGITGSNGKTTTTLFITHLLQQMGKRALAVGNVGLSLLSQVEADVDVFVIELSSFQLEEITARPVLDAAVILNITPNHLDHHASFQEYVHAKFSIQKCLKENGRLFINQKIVDNFGVPKRDFAFFDLEKEKVERYLSLSYREGKAQRFYAHDSENFSVAKALLPIDEESFCRGVDTFKKPAHRMEWVASINGINYINDSKATSVDAVVKAIEAIPSPLVLIAGGVDKGGSFKEWIHVCQNKVKKVLAMGEAAARIYSELNPLIEVERIDTLEEGIKKAQLFVVTGDTVLLSPGCSSYDQFKDYQDRGEKFKKLVGLLEEKIS